MESKVDIFICSYLRQPFTAETIKYIKERTTTPYKLFLLDNGGNSEFASQVDYYVGFKQNMGIHAIWNTALALATTDYFITTDNDILVPSLDPDWLSQMIKFMDERPDYGAISMHPHVFIGALGIDPNDPQDVVERNMCGAVMRIMRRSAVMQVGGWEHKIDPRRNHEERTICSRLQDNGYKVGICSRIRAYHNFGKKVGGNWGYPSEITPEIQGHNPAIAEYVLSFDNRDSYNELTWMPK
jgi:GT2 family glycosyltransferase